MKWEEDLLVYLKKLEEKKPVVICGDFNVAHTEKDIKKLSENKFTVDGAMLLDDVSQLIGYNFPETDCDTIAGFILEKTGEVPTEGQHPVVYEDNLKLTVLKVEDRRIAQIMIEKNIKGSKEGNK